MENLFSEDPQFRRVQYKKLSDNVREWQQEIAALVAEKLPKDMGLNVVVTFQKVDDEKGYAIGSAVASDEGGNSIGIPAIVRSWNLAPIDLFFKENKVYPLTDDNLAKVFYQSSMGTGLAPINATPSMADDSFAEVRNPPLGGKYSYSSPHSMLGSISGTMGAEDLRLFKTAVASTPALLAAYHRRGTDRLLHKIAAEKPKETEQDDSNKERASEVFTVKKDGPNQYRLFSAPDEVYDPVMVSTDRQGLKRFLEMRRSELWDYEQDPLNSIDQYGHFTVIPPEAVYGKEVDGPAGDISLGQHRNPWVFDPLQDDRIVRTVDKFGRYGVKDADGVMAKGWVIPNVVDFDGAAKPIKLFLGKNLASMQGRIAGIALNDDADVTLQADRPDTGKMGTLVYRDGDRVMATCPFQVTSVTVYKNLRSLGVVDYQGKIANLIISPNVDGIVAVDEKRRNGLGPLMGTGKNYIVSAKMFFVRMPRLCNVSEGPDDFKRMAAEWLDKNPIKVAMANGRYIFKGGAIQKYADDAAKRGDILPPAKAPPARDVKFPAPTQSLDKTKDLLGGLKQKAEPSIGTPPPAPMAKSAGLFFNGGSMGKLADGAGAMAPTAGAQTQDIKPLAQPKPIQQPATGPALNPKQVPVTGPGAGAMPMKTAFDFNSLARHEAEFLLGYWGLGAEKVAEVLDRAKDHIRLEVHHLRFPKVGHAVKTASPKVKAFIDSVKSPISDLLKCAASIDDAQAVDAVLSLGFVNNENIARFSSAKPMLEEVSQMLAKLLLASRLGMEDIPEENVRGAMAHVQKILSGLERLSMLSKTQEKTSAARPRPVSYVGGRLLPAASPYGFVR